MEYMIKLLDQMVTLDCPSMIGPVYSAVWRADAVPEKEYKAQWKTVVKNIKRLCKKAEKRGKQICMEPLNRFETDFINTCDQGLKMIKAVGNPALKLHLDTFHMNIEEKDQGAAIRKAGKHLGHFHACGSDRGNPSSTNPRAASFCSSRSRTISITTSSLTSCPASMIDFAARPSADPCCTASRMIS